MKILVTGGAGYIGSKIVTDLIKKKHKVYVVDNLSTGHRFLINKKAVFLKSNIANKYKINNFIKKYKIQSIIHCAASLDIEESEKNPNKYYLNNFLNTKKFLEVCIKNNLKNFIFSSTCAVYGNVSGAITEKFTPRPIGVYGKTKYKCELLIKRFAKKYNFNYGILRYFNVAGSDLKNKIGCINKNNQLIKNLAIAINKKKNSISVYGKNYKTKDGTCIRDYIFLSDLSMIHYKLFKLISHKNKSYVLNCGYGRGFSVLEIIKNFEKIFKVKIKINFLERRKGDIAEIFSNTKKFSKILNIKFKKNNLKKIITSAVKWEELLNKK